MTLDEKIHDIAVGYVSKMVGGRKPWSFTTIGELHPSLIHQFQLQDGELVVVSGFFSNDNWYVFTTRRIVSQFQGKFQSLDPSRDFRDDFGNFKGYGPDKEDGSLPDHSVVPREIATLTAIETGEVVRFEFATWEESMLPIYAARYWSVKHPVLHKLMTTAEHALYKESR